MGSFSYIPIIAAFCYLFMGMTFLASKRTRIINAFLWMLVLLILWSGASFCMRIQLWPSTKFWYDISLLGLLMFPCGLLNFVYEFIGVKRTPLRKTTFFFLLLINIINILTGFFLAYPEVVEKDNGQYMFVYHPTWAVSILFIICVFVVIIAIVILFKSNGNSKITSQQFIPILAGIGALLVGNAMIMFPAFEGIPLDIASGVIYAMCLFYALYKKRIFRLTLLISRTNCYILSAIISALLFMNLIYPTQRFFEEYSPLLSKYSVLVIALLFTIATNVVYLILKKFIDTVFIKGEMVQAEHLKQFSIAVSNSLSINQILDNLVEIIHTTIPVKQVYVCISDDKKQTYPIIHSTSPLDQNTFTFMKDNPIVKYLKENDECMIMKDFKRITMYKSMWENEKEQLLDLKIECIVPIKYENDLVGIILLSNKGNKIDFTYDEINFLDSVKGIASIAIKNSMLYENALMESRMDELTGLINRKYFYEILDLEYKKCNGNSLVLISISLDDFNLYNQLYGNKEGDIALQNVSNIIKTCVGTSGYVARYSGKAFSVIMPNCDLLSAKNMGEMIREHIMGINKKSDNHALKVLTVSIGICSIPNGATTIKQLLDNVDMAVYQVKRKGKNGIMVASTGRPIEGKKINCDFTPREDIFSEYANTIAALTAAIDAKDHYTFSHSKNVSYYSAEIANALGLNEDTIEIIREAALLHDIGKIGVSEEIINKPGKLTDKEYEIIKGHVENAIGIIRHLPSLDYVIPAVIGHHERYDGGGYPRRIAGEDIPLSARILCIADSFDAMLSWRKYKEPYQLNDVLNILDNQAGKQFDPHLAHLLIELVESGKIVPQQYSNMPA